MFSAFARRAVRPMGRRLASHAAEHAVAPKIEPVVIPMPSAKPNARAFARKWTPDVNENTYLALGVGAFFVSIIIAASMGTFKHFNIVRHGYAQASKPVPRTE